MTLQAIDRCLDLEDADVARYDDPRRAVGRRVALEGGRLRAVRLSGDVAPASWLREWLVAGEDVRNQRAVLLLPSAAAPRGYRSRGRIVCNCFDVAESEIADALAATSFGGGLSHVQATLRCGTNCGSCLPELKRMVAA